MPVSPPPDLVNGDILEVTLIGSLFNQTILNVFHYRLDDLSASSLPDVYQDLHDALSSIPGLYNLYLQCCTAEYTLVKASIQAIKSVRFARTYFPISNTGLRAGVCRTADISGVIEKSTWFAFDHLTTQKRGMTGSVHVAGISDLDCIDGLLVDDWVRGCGFDLGTALNEVLTGGLGNTYVPIIYHRDAASNALFTDVTAFDVKKEVRVMRRRTVGRGI